MKTIGMSSTIGRSQFGKLIVLGLMAALPLPSTVGQQFSDWSAPVNLGPVVNSTAADGCPALSRDGLSL